MPPADAIVVLGCRLRPDGSPSRQLRERVACALDLYRAGAAPLLLLAGGGLGPVAEAEAMRGLAREAGVAEAALLCEPWSRTTAENALYAASLLRERGVSRVVLVSHGTHLLRARPLFRLAGLDVVAAAGVPARSAGAALASTLYNLAALPRSILAVLRIWGSS